MIKNPTAIIFKYLSISIIFMLLGVLFGKAFIPAALVYKANIFLITFTVFLLLMALFTRKNIIPKRFSIFFVYVFTFIDGILLYPVLTYYLASLGANFVITILITTIIIFAILSLISYKKEPTYFLRLGPSLLILLLAIIVGSLINIFIGSDIASLFISLVSILVFSGYVLYDISLIKHDIRMGHIKDKKDISIYVLDLYLDFINIFLDLLNIADKLD